MKIGLKAVECKQVFKHVQKCILSLSCDIIFSVINTPYSCKQAVWNNRGVFHTIFPVGYFIKVLFIQRNPKILNDCDKNPGCTPSFSVF